MRNSWQRLLVAACVVSVVGSACSNADSDSGSDVDEIRIGALEPTSGPSAVGGTDSMHGIELAVEIINGKFPDIDLPLAAEEGLPNLGNAKITLAKADTKGEPETGGTEAERLVTDEKVVALTGAYNSAVTKTASEKAERLKVPFVNGESSSTSLTERGLDWFYRVGPTDQMFGETFFSLLKEQNGKQNPVQKIAMLNSNDEFGKSGATVTAGLAEDNGFNVVATVPYDPEAQDLTSSVTKIRDAQPDVVFLFSLLNDTRRIVSAFKTLDYWPPAVMGYGGGVSDPNFVQGAEAQQDAQGIVRRSAWSPDIAERNPTAKKIADLFRQKFNADMTENSARSFSALMTLAMAINEAKSTEPDAIRSALRNIDIPGGDLIVPWDGVRFDDNHQNIGARGVLEQFIGSDWKVIYPSEVRAQEIVWPLLDARTGDG